MMKKSATDYTKHLLRRASLFPALILLLILGIGKHSSPFFASSQQISLSPDESRVSDGSEQKAKATSSIVKEGVNSSAPISAISWLEGSEDDTEDDQISSHSPHFLLGIDPYRSGPTALLKGKLYKKERPLYILFHSWKTHLV